MDQQAERAELIDRLRQLLLEGTPSAELMLGLAPLMPPRLVDWAEMVTLDLGGPLRPEIVRRLAGAADEFQRERLLQYTLPMVLGEPEPAVFQSTLEADVEAALAGLDEYERSQVLGPLMLAWMNQLGLGAGPPEEMAAANGGDEGHAANGGGAGQAANGGGAGQAANGGGAGHAANGGGDIHAANGGGDLLGGGQHGVAGPGEMTNGRGAGDEELPEDSASDTGGPVPRRRPRVVSTGFAAPHLPRRPLPRREPLKPSTAYYFWLDIGRPVRGSIEQQPTEILADERLEVGSRLRVVVFPYEGELQLEPQSAEGEFFLDRDGWFRVLRLPGAPPIDEPPPPPAGRPRPHRLFFPLTTPAAEGVHRLRCNIYFRNVLVQSRVVSAAVGQAVVGEPALKSMLEYSLARLLSSGELAPIRQHVLSIVLNDNGAGTHEFRFLGEQGTGTPFVENASFGEGELTDLINKARRALRRTTWGSEEALKESDRYRYRPGATPSLRDDLVELMDRGLVIYDALINRLAGGADAADALREQMRTPGRVQLVSHGKPSELVPASMVYDYVDVIPSAGLTLCPGFVADRATPGLALEDAACFNGECPSRAKRDTLCPSGFWGFRHALGMPVMFKPETPAPVESKFSGQPVLGMALFPGFKLIGGHRQAIAAKLPGWSIDVADTLDETLDLLGRRPHVTYFYCHGGTARDEPYLQVGPKDGPRLRRMLLRRANPERSAAPRTLVIINGCKTAALEPDRAIELVSAFVENVGAMGVIGTEVTIFEELAIAFGERLLDQLRGGREIGEAVRRARLALLKDGNPLGLVYVPFVAADARLVESD